MPSARIPANETGAHPARVDGGDSRTDRGDDVVAARRGVASFGRGDDPSVPELLRAFVRRYGWRSYALPILVVVTVVALFTARGGSSTAQGGSAAGRHGGGVASAPSTPPLATGNLPLKSDTPHGQAYDEALKAGALPAGRPYTMKGDGTFRVMKVPAGDGTVVGRSAGGQVFRYDVEVEKGITGIAGKQFASMVHAVLADPRSWSGHGVALQQIDSGQADFHVSMTTALTVRKLCGYSIQVETSCYVTAGSVAGLNVNRVVFDDARWVRGAAPYVGDLKAYRTYMINHEDGHAIGHRHAHECLPGGLAPVMMQQTFGVKSAVSGKECEANPWPYAAGAKGAPGAEQPDTPQNDEYNLGGGGD